ncbi:MAG: imelysin family protein [Gammaproteobacteria bacterium]
MAGKWCGVVLISSALLLAGCKDDMTSDQRWVATATRQIVEDHIALAERTEKQVEQAQSFCREPSAAGLSKMQQRWRDSMSAWQQLQWVRFGPITDNNLDWKLQFWPDKKNILQRKVQTLLESGESISPQTLARASVVAQGFSAQELLLFDQGFASTQAFSAGHQCELLMASSQLTADVTAQLAGHWQDKTWLEQWLQPPTTVADQSAAHSRAGELFDALLSQVERIKIDKLGEPLGMKTRDKKPNGYFAESWRSQHSLHNIEQNLAAVESLITPRKGYGLFQYLKDQQHPEVAEELVIRFDNLQLALQQIEQPLNIAVMDDGRRQAVQAAVRNVGELASFLKQRVAPALGLALGFNANDGD